MANVNLTSPETVARAVTGVETSPAVGPANPQDVEARRIRQEAIDRGPRSVLEAFQAPKMPDQASSTSFINQNFYSEYAADGGRIIPPGARGAETRARRQATQEREATARTFIERGFTALNANQRRDAVTFAREALERWPEARALFNNLPAGVREARIRQTVQTMLEDPQFRPFAQKIFAEAFDQGNMPDIDPLMIARLTRAEQARTLRQEAVDNNAIQRTTLTAEITGLRTATTPEGVRLQTLRANRTNLEQERQMIQEEIEDRRQNIALNTQRLAAPTITPAERATLNAEITTWTGEVNAYRPQLAVRQNALTELQMLEQRVTNGEQERRRLIEETEGLRQQLDQAAEAYDTARIDVESSRNAHIRAEQQMVDRLRDVFREGMQQYLEKRVTDAEAAQGRVMEEDANRKDPLEDRVAAYLDQRYERYIQRGGLGRLWNPSNREFNRFAINADYRTLVNQGPDLLLRQVIGTNQMRDERGVARAAMTPAEVDQWIANNGEAATRLRGQIVEKLLTERIQTGRVTEGDARFIAGTPWGREAINKAITNRTEIRAALDKLREDGVIRNNPSEWLQEQLRGNPAFWLMILLGGGAIGAIAPAVAASIAAGTGLAGATAGGLALSASGAALGVGAAGGALVGGRVVIDEAI